MAPIDSVVPTPPTYKPFVVNKMHVECHLRTGRFYPAPSVRSLDIACNAVTAAITTGSPVLEDYSLAATLVLRALLPDAVWLSAGERHRCLEWLELLANG